MDDAPEAPAPTPVVVFDLDGVLADHRHRLGLIRGRKQWERYFAASDGDTLSSRGMRELEEQRRRGDVVILTGRPRRHGAQTRRWLEANGVTGYRLIMRGDDDRRPSGEFKRRELEKLMVEHQVLVMVDDEPAVIKVARELGIEAVLATWAGRR